MDTSRRTLGLGTPYSDNDSAVPGVEFNVVVLGMWECVSVYVCVCGRSGTICAYVHMFWREHNAGNQLALRETREKNCTGYRKVSENFQSLTIVVFLIPLLVTLC